MRVPTEAPRRRFRLRGWLIALVAILVVLLFSLRGLAGFYTDYLWFDSLEQSGTWSSLLAAKVAPALVFTVVFFAIMYANLVIADRIAPKYRAMGPEDEFIARYRQATGRFTGRIRIGVALFFALIAGIGVSSQWKQWVLFTNATQFGVKDPQFHKDVGFYVFKLPFIEFILEWLFAGLVIVLIVTAVEHYLNGGIRFQTPFQRVTPQVKAHLSVILAIMALVKTAQYYFGKFALTLSTQGVVEGAGYTDVNAKLPALELLIFISIVSAGLFIWNIWRRGWVLPILAVGLWAFVSLVIGTIYPAAIQQFRVGPNEFATERPYIDRNIRSTRQAFGLDKVEPESYDFTSFDQVSSPEDIVGAQNSDTIANARLWDPLVIQSTFSQLQKLATFYQIGDVDVDRYLVDNTTRQVMIAARNLNSADLPSQSFVNRHIVYTHGYGVVASPSNDVDSDGSPLYFLSDVPVQTVENAIPIDQGPASEIYFGEGLTSYVLTDAEQREFNYQTNAQADRFTRYRGKDGITLSNWVRRAAFALRFGSIDPLISGQVTSKTRLLMERDIRARVEKLAPFLSYDADPYPVVLGDRTLWVMDAYTSTAMYPYSQALTGEGGLAHSLNYVRNSVKVTVDAYEGTVTFYVFDEEDPVIRAWRKAFPDLFTDKDAMSPELEAHLRYPEDLFKAQSNQYGRYHVTEPKRFYDGSATWLVSPDPGTSVETFATNGATAATTNNEPQAATSTGKRIDPYYLNLKLPDDDEQNFVIITPFVPVSSGNSIQRLVSFLTAKSDPGPTYGQLQSFVMPSGNTVNGPLQVSNVIDSTDRISSAVTLLNTQGSRVIKGSLQLIPVGNSLIYVQPFYVRASGETGYPKFQFVAVFTQGKGAVCAPSIDEALDRLFAGRTGEQSVACTTQIAGTTEPGADGATDGDTSSSSTTTTTTAPAAGGSALEKLNRAAQLFDQADAALARQDLGEYQRLTREAQTLVRQARDQLGTG